MPPFLDFVDLTIDSDEESGESDNNAPTNVIPQSDDAGTESLLHNLSHTIAPTDNKIALDRVLNVIDLDSAPTPTELEPSFAENFLGSHSITPILESETLNPISDGKRTIARFLDDPVSVTPTPSKQRRLNEPSIRKPEKYIHEKYKLDGIRLPPLSFPRSHYQGCEPPLKLDSEREVLDLFCSRDEAPRDHYGGRGFISFDLEDFVIYRPDAVSRLPGEMVSLHEACLKQTGSVFFFDGILKDGHDRKYVQKVPFELVSIGGYEDVTQHSVGDDLWIQSIRCNNKAKSSSLDIWYCLKAPESSYARFHEPFRWLADFAKHFVDYLNTHSEVCLHHFRADFWNWAKCLHGDEAVFAAWHREFGLKTDFRQVIAAYPEFLYAQAVDLNTHHLRLPLWREVHPQDLTAVPEHRLQTRRTIVTPYVQECFKFMPWADHLSPGSISADVAVTHIRKCSKLGFTSQGNYSQMPTTNGLEATQLQIGDIIVTMKDVDTKWRGLENELWYAYIQGIKPAKRPGRSDLLDVIWLYKSTDTPIAGAHYPFQDELFFSDNCNCADRKVKTEEVVRKLDVTLFASGRQGSASHFIRQKYRCESQAFVTLKQEDLKCDCLRLETSRASFGIGDTILVQSSTISDVLEPVEVVSMDEAVAVVREFLRRARDFGDTAARPNELVHTERLRTVKCSLVNRKCRVRFYSEADRLAGKIPAPYNRDGTGDCFYFSAQEHQDGKTLVALQCCPSSLRQGFDPTISNHQKLRGLDLFAGGGNFGRGLEEGGSIHNMWAVDWATKAMHTYRANLQKTKNTQLFLGSSNDFLSLAMRGSHQVAQIDDIDFVSAGSPCQGYSTANSVKSNEQGMRNCSMLANAASYIDFYRPQYALLENVTTMASRSLIPNPLSHLLGCFVGMGYQTQMFYLDAWSFGSAQSRTRLFISVAAPNLQLPSHPHLTHAHPPSTTSGSLGIAANGLRFGERRFEIPIFDHVSAREACKDLPRLSDGRASCIRYPDHRVVRTESLLSQNRIRLIPKAPYRQGFIRAVASGRMSRPQTEDFKKKVSKKRQKIEKNRAWSRVHPDRLVPTITTVIRPACAYTGTLLHWEEDRILTLMEARRAQGFPDHEVLIGRSPEQWKIVGNSVARQVSIALGLTISDAHLANLRASGSERMDTPVTVDAEVQDNESIRTNALKIDQTAGTTDPDQLSSERAPSSSESGNSSSSSSSTPPTSVENFIKSSLGTRKVL